MDFKLSISEEIASALKAVYDAEPLSVSEIAADVGYSDYNYFIKVFKKATGVTPLKYRKQNS